MKRNRKLTEKTSIKKVSNEVILKQYVPSATYNLSENCFLNEWSKSSVTLSKLDKARQLILSNDCLMCRGCEGGYRMIRATHGVHNGTYYYEVEIKKSFSDDAHLRIGWSTRQGELQGPVGFDKYSYGYRDVNALLSIPTSYILIYMCLHKGAAIYNSCRNDFYGDGSSYTVGDVIGCYLLLDDTDPELNEIRFFKNSHDQGIAFKGKDIIPSGVYFPAISLYQKALVAVNFGPSWIYKNTNIYNANPYSELQPMNPAERKDHDIRIEKIRKALNIQ